MNEGILYRVVVQEINIPGRGRLVEGFLAPDQVESLQDVLPELLSYGQVVQEDIAPAQKASAK